jgi:alpha-tubulin suppressor-like RCC1 family protein
MYVTAFTCSGSTADPDLGDTITYHYRWATEAPDGSTSVIENATANRAVIYPNQSVRCQVIATDAHGYETASLWSVPMTGHDSSNWYDPYGNAVYSANLYAANVSVDGPSFSANAPTFAEQLQAGSHDSGSTPNPIPPAYLSALGLDRDMDSYRYRCGGGEGIASYQLDGVEVQSLATSEDLVVPRSSLLAGSFLGHSVDGANLTCTISSLEGEPVASASGHVRMLSVQIQPATSVFTADDVDFSKPLAASGVIGCVVDGEVVSPSTKQQSSDLYDQSLCQLSTWSSSGSLWPATEDPICSWPPQEEVFFITATGVNKTGVGISRLQCQISRSGGEVSSIACAPTTSSQNLADESGPFFESGTSSNTVSNPVTKIVSTARGFAAIHQDGSVSTWGQHRPGDGISYDLASSVRTRLDAKPVSDIVASSWHHNRFVAIHTDGTLTTWGEEYSQRDMATQFSEVEGDMVNVREVVANRSGAFAVIHQDDSVTTFGAGRYGGVAPPLEDVQQVVANDLAFAALHEDGSVTAWGSLDAGGGVTLPPGAVDIVATRYAFAALYSDGSVKAFGAPSFGGSISHIESELSGAVEAIFSSDRSFVAVYEDGTAIRWGHYSGYSPTSGQMSFLQAQAPSEIVSISSLYPENREGYWSQLVALRADGLVDPVGSSFYHAADDDYPEALKSPISALASDSRSHLAIHQSGDVTVWGSSVTDHLQDGGQVITRLSSRPAPVSALSSYRGFAIIHEDGSVTSWRGRVLTNYTWSTSGFLHSVEDRLNGASPVTEIVTTLYSFAAIHEDGSVTTWGLSSSGGDSRGVSGLR